jgi:folate-dependent phosphoribosylglycinamide formyltransferase PurN
MKLAVLISNTGTGTNLKAIIDGIASKRINAKIALVVSDREDAPGLLHAKNNTLPVQICAKKEDLLPMLANIGPDYICLAGWKQFIPDEVISAFPNKILNLHPGLIPDELNSTVSNPDGTPALWNKGMLANKAIGNFIDSQATFAGSSIHFLTNEFDFGPVLGRTFEKILPGDTVDSLYTRLKKKENDLYILVLEKLTHE